MLDFIYSNIKTVPISEVQEIMENSKYNYHGFRCATIHDLEIIKNRSYLDCSFDMVDGEKVGLLGGTSVIGIYEHLSNTEITERYYHTLKYYCSESKIIMLCGDSLIDYGNDENEIILGSNGYGANVLAIVVPDADYTPGIFKYASGDTIKIDSKDNILSIVINNNLVASVKVRNNSEFVYKLTKSGISGRNAAEGIKDFLVRSLQDKTCLCLAEKVINHAINLYNK